MAETKTPGNDGAHTRPPAGAALALFGVVLFLAALLRVWSAGGDLWLDEVWSLYNLDLARAGPSAGRWTALFFHTNTHAANTLYLALIGPDAGPFAYRGLSVVSSIATVAMAAAIGWRRSAREGLLAASLVAVSYPMVHYAGEARGYAPMLLAALAAFYLLESVLEKATPGRVVGFIAVSLFGLAAHLTFVVIQAFLGLWAAVVLFRRLSAVVPVLARLSALFGVQAVALAAFAAVAVNNVHGMTSAHPIAAGMDVMAALTFGVDPSRLDSLGPAFGWAFFSALGLGLGGAVWGMFRKGDGAWIFFFTVVLLFPVGFVLTNPPLETLPRHFIAIAPIALIAAARGLSLLMDRNGPARWAAGALLALFFIGQGVLLDTFFAAGRGSYAEALKFIAEAGKAPVKVAGYHILRAGEMIKYHARKAGLADKIRFVPPEEDAQAPATWFIGGSYGDDFGGPPPPREISRPAKDGSRPGGLSVTYRLKAVYPHWGLSGDTWALYRRQGG
ncbi:MAG: hypothetical protein V3U48_01050 [Rhodospirillales bacterium]